MNTKTSHMTRGRGRGEGGLDLRRVEAQRSATLRRTAGAASVRWVGRDARRRLFSCRNQPGATRTEETTDRTDGGRRGGTTNKSCALTSETHRRAAQSASKNDSLRSSRCLSRIHPTTRYVSNHPVRKMIIKNNAEPFNGDKCHLTVRRKRPFTQVEGKQGSRVSYRRRRPGSSAASVASASAPRSRPQNTVRVSLSEPALPSRPSAYRRPPSPRRGATVSSGRLPPCLFLRVRVRVRGWSCCRCWRGAHVWEPLVQTN